MAFTLADYEKAKADLAEHEARWDAYTGNNPEKGKAARDACGERVRLIEASLKAAGVLPQTAQERLEQALDRAFPNAKSNQIVEFEGRQYQLKFRPAARSRSGKSVTRWKRWWRNIVAFIAVICVSSIFNTADSDAVTVSGAASATNYECRLPLVTTSELVNGGPKTKTNRDDTVVFVVRVSPAGDFAVIDGVRFQLIKGPDYLAFFGAAVGMSSGVDVLTIYDTRVGGGRFSVESRQVTISGKPIASQMVGVCVPL